MWWYMLELLARRKPLWLLRNRSAVH